MYSVSVEQAMHACSQKSLYNSSISDAFPKGRRSISNPTTQADDLFAFSIVVHGRRRELEMELSVFNIFKERARGIRDDNSTA